MKKKTQICNIYAKEKLIVNYKNIKDNLLNINDNSEIFKTENTKVKQLTSLVIGKKGRIFHFFPFILATI